MRYLLFIFFFYHASLLSGQEINDYDCFNPVLGGDSVYKEKNKPFNGWLKIKYENNEWKHQGYYERGRLKICKNFYPNGQEERIFIRKNQKKSTLESFYPNGQNKIIAEYIFTEPQYWESFYPDGTRESIEVFNKKMNYYIRNEFYTSDGNPLILLNLEDEAGKRYVYKEYYPGGKLKETGPKIWNPLSGDYLKTGDWKTYDQEGKIIRKEFYDKGRLLREEIIRN